MVVAEKVPMLNAWNVPVSLVLLLAVSALRSASEEVAGVPVRLSDICWLSVQSVVRVVRPTRGLPMVRGVVYGKRSTGNIQRQPAEGGLGLLRMVRPLREVNDKVSPAEFQ